jgi:hypothetical protein
MYTPDLDSIHIEPMTITYDRPVAVGDRVQVQTLVAVMVGVVEAVHSGEFKRGSITYDNGITYSVRIHQSGKNKLSPKSRPLYIFEALEVKRIA